MTRARAIVGLLLTPWLLSCGAGAGAGNAAPVGPAASSVPGGPVAEGELEVRPAERTRPSLRLGFPYANRSARLGYGGVQLWARPERDEIRVSAIVDAPSKDARWFGCRDAALVVDGERIELAPIYVGGPMDSGFYDAVRVDLGIHQLRTMARARRVSGTVCGDPIEITAAQRRSLARFVRWFDRIAEPVQRQDAPGFREVGPRVPVLPTDDVLDDTTHPA